MKVKYYDLENKRVFITGGGSGIGASIVEHFCEQGSEVYFIDINEDESKKSTDEIQKISSLLGEAMDAGAFGFSSTVLNQHLGFKGRPLACRLASDDELKAYANVLKEKNKGSVEIA